MSIASASLGLALLSFSSPAPAPVDDPPAQRWIEQLRPTRNMWELGGFGGAFIIPRQHDLYDLDTLPRPRFAKVAPEVGFRAAYYPLSFLGLEGEFSGMWSHIPAGGEPVFLYGLRGHAILQLPLYRVAPFLLGGFGNLGVRSSEDAVGSDIDPAAHYGIGLKVFLSRYIAIRVDGRHIMSAASARRREVTHYGSVTFGVSVTLGRPKKDVAGPNRGDADRDAVPDARDACPTTYGVGPDGCAPVDGDRDGVLDDADRCPAEAGTMTDGCVPKDQDEDGFVDNRDACPEQAGLAPDGCVPDDADRDGFMSTDDACPQSAGVVPDGCPKPNKLP